MDKDRLKELEGIVAESQRLIQTIKSFEEGLKKAYKMEGFVIHFTPKFEIFYIEDGRSERVCWAGLLADDSNKIRQVFMDILQEKLTKFKKELEVIDVSPRSVQSTVTTGQTAGRLVRGVNE